VAALRDHCFLELAYLRMELYQDNVINDDALWYLEAAGLFSAGEWISAYNRYPWPLYPLLISLTSQTTGFDFEYAAHLINAVFYALVMIFFVKLTRELGGNKQVTIAAVILVLIYPGLNDYRSMILRDSGYWAFFLLSILLFLRYFVKPGWRYALGWAACMLTATLFRVEGLVFFIFLPLVALARGDVSWSGRLVLLAKASSVLLVVALVNLVIIAIQPQWSLTEEGKLGFSVDWLLNAGSVLLRGLSEKADLISSVVLERGPPEYAMAIAIGAVIIILVLKFIEVLTLVYAVLAAYAVKKRILFQLPHAHLVWLWLIILNVLILFGFVARYYLVQGRYFVPLCLLVMLPVPFLLASIYRQWSTESEHKSKNTWILLATCVFLLIVAIDGLVSFGPDKHYMKEAGLWLKEKRGGDDAVFANEAILLYYAGEQGVTAIQRDYSWEHALSVMREGREIDYYAIRVRRKHPTREKEAEAILGEPLKRFANRRGDRVLVFAGKKTGAS
jgi:hypothetical protein